MARMRICSPDKVVVAEQSVQKRGAQMSKKAYQFNIITLKQCRVAPLLGRTLCVAACNHKYLRSRLSAFLDRII